MRGVPKLILFEADPVQDATQWHPKAYPSRLRHPTSTQRTSPSSVKNNLIDGSLKFIIIPDAI